MTRWFRAYWDEEDTWFYIEAGDDGWVTRQIEFQGPDQRVLAAASLTEWQAACESGNVGSYESIYGRTAELPVHEWEGYDPQPLTSLEFDQAWAEARRCLGGEGDATRLDSSS